MLYLVFLGGVIFDCILHQIMFRTRTGRGYFRLESFDNDDTGFYKVNIAIVPGQNLLKKRYIFLKKDNSPK